jgi:DNA-binding CsgD family transcriptional regulator
MSTRITEGLRGLTDKEKQTLRLIVRGHDAKSSARKLGLSVHTINERLRDARRKLAVSSSREAARLLFEAESHGPPAPNPEYLGDMGIGEDAAGPPMDQGPAPISGAGRRYRHPRIIIGVLLMTIILGLVALATFGQGDAAPTTSPTASRTAPESEAVDFARQWLALLDQGHWDETYRLTAASFREANSAQVWAAESEKARPALGAVISRNLVGAEHFPAPPHGYEVVKFRTRFANKAEALETVTLDRENGNWRVVGVTIG